MHLTIEEAGVRNVSLITCSAVAVVVALRALAAVLSATLTRFRVLQGRSGTVLEACSLATTFILFSADSGLTLPALCVALGAALVVGWSPRSVRALFIVLFVLVSVISSPLLSRSLTVMETPSASGRWAASFKGEQARVAAIGDACPAAAGPLAPRRLHVYYDNVRLEVDRARPAAPCVFEHTQSLSVAQAMPPPGGVAAHGPTTSAASVGGAVLWQQVISIGAHTQVVGLNVADMPNGEGRRDDGHLRRDAVVLLGDRSALRDSFLHCDGAAGASPCIIAHPRTTFTNVTVSVFSAGQRSAHGKESVRVEMARDCDELVQVLRSAAKRAAAAESAWTRLVTCGAWNASAVDNFARLLAAPSGGNRDAYIHDAGVFLEGLPVLLAWRWYLPDSIHRIQETLLLVANTVGSPVAAASMAGSRCAWRAAAAASRLATRQARHLFAWTAAQMKQTAPLAAQAVHQLASGSLGLLCGGTRVDGGDHKQLPLRACARRTAEPAYTVGAQVHDGLVAATAAALDALELVPGVWGLVRWGWMAEWRTTVFIVDAVHSTVRLTVHTLALPAARGVKALLALGSTVLPHCTGLAWLFGRTAHRALEALWPFLLTSLRAAQYALLHSSLGGTVQSAGVWLLHEELREQHAELELLKQFARSLGGGAVAAVGVAWRALGALLWTCRLLLRWYGTTSFSIHVSIAILQTVLLLVAVRNEIKELVEREEQQRRRTESSRSQSSSTLGIDTLAQRLARRLRQTSALTHINGIALFARAHYYTCTQYVVTHLVAFVALVGLSVLPLTGKLYSITLHFIFPWVSSQTFLCFFIKPAPTRQQVGYLWTARMLFAILFQRTIGDLLYRLVRDLLIALSVFVGMAVMVWAWPRRGIIVRRVATAISESLNNTPARKSPAPASVRPAAATAAQTGCDDAEPDGVDRLVVLDEAAASEGNRTPLLRPERGSPSARGSRPSSVPDMLSSELGAPSLAVNAASAVQDSPCSESSATRSFNRSGSERIGRGVGSDAGLGASLGSLTRQLRVPSVRTTAHASLDSSRTSDGPPEKE